jgi:phage baseplate assembly protein gpV
MSAEYGISEFIQDGIEYHTRQMNTAIPGVVVTVRQSLHQMTVDVQPMVSFMTEDGESIDRPVVLNVPIHFPTSKKSGMTFPVEPGDPVFLIYSMRNMDSWKRQDGTQSAIPTDNRKFDKKDCVAIPGVFPFSQSPNDPGKHTHSHDSKDTVMYSNLGDGNEVEVRLKPDGNLIINAPTKVTVFTKDAEVNVENSTIVNTNTAVVNADTSVDVNTNMVTVNAPNSLFTGNVTITGLLTWLNGMMGFGGTFGSSKINGNITLETGDLEVESGNVAFAGGSMTHNGVNVGSTHIHRGVVAGGDLSQGPQ